MACGPSSADLKTNVASFMHRAELVERNPLAGQHSTIKVQARLNETTGELEPVSLYVNLLDEAQLGHLANLLRSIIFVEQDPISLNVLTKAIEREHVLLRGIFKPLRDDLKKWRRHMFVGSATIGAAEPPLPEGQTRLSKVEMWPTDRDPPGVVMADLAPDYEYADAYFNAMVWHSDTAKSREYLAASEYKRQHYAKCAEIRTLSAVRFVWTMREMIEAARTDGHDF